MEAATAERTKSTLDPGEVAKQAAEIAGEDNGLAPAPGDDGVSRPDYGDGLQDETTPEPEPEPEPGTPAPAGDGAQPPTPPANLPDDPGGAEEDAVAPQLFVSGERQIGVKVGGRKPDSSVLKLKGGKIDLGGQFDRGDRFLAVATLQVVGDNDQDTIDKQSGEVKSTSKAQSAALCGFARIEEFLAQKIEDKVLLNKVLEALDLVDES